MMNATKYNIKKATKSQGIDIYDPDAKGRGILLRKIKKRGVRRFVVFPTPRCCSAGKRTCRRTRTPPYTCIQARPRARTGSRPDRR